MSPQTAPAADAGTADVEWARAVVAMLLADVHPGPGPSDIPSMLHRRRAAARRLSGGDPWINEHRAAERSA